MKTLQFLERDYKCRSSEDSIRAGKINLKYYSNLPTGLIDSMDVHYQYHHKEEKELLKLLFNPGNILVAYSMYVQGSDYDFLRFVELAGKNKVKGVTYVDASGCLKKFLDREILTTDFVKGINNNNIITIDIDEAALDDGFERLTIHKRKGFERFSFERVNLLDILLSVGLEGYPPLTNFT